MVALFRTQGVDTEAWVIGDVHACRGLGEPLAFDDPAAALAWLAGFDADALRRVAHRYDLSGTTRRLQTHRVLRNLAADLVTGRLRACRAGGGVGAGAGDAEGATAEVARLLPRLTRTSRDFVFQGQPLRVIAARQWSSLRWRTDRRYQVLDRAAAAKLLAQVAEWPSVDAEERQALASAKSMLSDSRATGDVAGSFFLLRALPQAAGGEAPPPAPTPTPSKRVVRPPAEVLHWIDIALVDPAGRPVPGQAFTLRLPDGEIRHGKLDGAGRASVTGIKVPGRCQVSFPDLDAKAWRAA